MLKKALMWVLDMKMRKTESEKPAEIRKLSNFRASYLFESFRVAAWRSLRSYLKPFLNDWNLLDKHFFIIKTIVLVFNHVFISNDASICEIISDPKHPIAFYYYLRARKCGHYYYYCPDSGDGYLRCCCARQHHQD
jgi:hypothetical protein